MSETDVKVKFGADFSEINEGAETAVKSSGSALNKYFGDFAKGIKDKLAKAFSLDTIVSKFVDGIGEQLEKFKEIDTLSRKLNVSRVELQQFAKIGKEFNIDMATMGRNISFANRVLGASAQGNVTARETLLRLGFTQKEINSGNIKSTEILYKLSEQYDINAKRVGVNAASNILAKNTTDAFGKGSDDLVTILKQGNEALKQRIDLMGVYSESEIRAGAAAARSIERQQNRVKKVFGKMVAYGGETLELKDLSDMIRDFEESNSSTQYNRGMFAASPFEKSSEFYKDKPGEFNNLIKSIIKSGSAEGMTPADLAEMYANAKTDSSKQMAFYKQISDAITSLLPKSINDALTETTGGTKSLVASSLQEIGGGDIGSVMSGLGPNAIAENTLRTAVATEQIAAQGPAQTQPAKLR